MKTAFCSDAANEREQDPRFAPHVARRPVSELLLQSGIYARFWPNVLRVASNRRNGGRKTLQRYHTLVQQAGISRFLGATAVRRRSSTEMSRPRVNVRGCKSYILNRGLHSNFIFALAIGFRKNRHKIDRLILYDHTLRIWHACCPPLSLGFSQRRVNDVE